jgi:hypothetical protein
MNNSIVLAEVDSILEGIDPCLQSPECTAIRSTDEPASKMIDDICKGLDSCLQSPECTDVRA